MACPFCKTDATVAITALAPRDGRTDDDIDTLLMPGIRVPQVVSCEPCRPAAVAAAWADVDEQREHIERLGEKFRRRQEERARLRALRAADSAALGALPVILVGLLVGVMSL